MSVAGVIRAALLAAFDRRSAPPRPTDAEMLEHQIDAAIALRKCRRTACPTEMQIAARKGVATKHRLKLERDPLLRGRSGV